MQGQCGLRLQVSRDEAVKIVDALAEYIKWKNYERSDIIELVYDNKGYFNHVEVKVRG